jgi:uncharacterized protein YraI
MGRNSFRSSAVNATLNTIDIDIGWMGKPCLGSPVVSMEEQAVPERGGETSMKTKLLCAVALCTAVTLPALAEAAEGYATANVNMRAGPSTAYPAVTLIPAGAPLSINGCLPDVPWCDVSFVGGRGWVAGRYVQVTYQQRQVYVGPQYYATLGIPVVGFNLDNYWGRYYRGRDFYGDRDRWRGERYWADRQDGSDWRGGDDRSGQDSRRYDRNAEWDNGPDLNPDWNGQQPDWNRRPNHNQDWRRQPDRAGNDQPRQNRPPTRNIPPPPGGQDIGPYSPDRVDPGYVCNNPVSECGPPSPRGSNR